MCGIIGILGKTVTRERLLTGIKNLEYRGYDSSGCAVLNQGEIFVAKAVGKVSALKRELSKTPIDGNVGIAHTRWATHGKPNKINAHPHSNSKIALVHNGIIENYQQLKEELIAKGYSFVSETDTEVILALITSFVDENMDFLSAVQKATKIMEGAFAIAVIFKNQEIIIGARKGAPLAVGKLNDELYIGSDALAMMHLTDQIAYLEEGDIAYLAYNEIKIFDENDQEAKRNFITISKQEFNIDKDGYEHHVLKEIYQQPEVINRVLSNYVDMKNNILKLPEMKFDWNSIPSIIIVACGSSYYAAYVAKYWFESIAKISVEIEIASEFRYRDICLKPEGLCIFISQSGETADTLAALRYAKKLKQQCLCLVNVASSSIAREAHQYIEIFAGVEVGVASTKAFSAQLVSLFCIILDAALKRKSIENDKFKYYLKELASLSGKISIQLNYENEVKKIAFEIANFKNILYTGRGLSYAIALEGALKLKELSYIHAEAIASGELKHGTIALIDKNILVIVISIEDKLFEKTLSNAHEIAARNGKIISITNKKSAELIEKICYRQIHVTNVDSLLSPIIAIIPIQLLAYHTSKFMKRDVDQPRNLAKSVTVE